LNEDAIDYFSCVFLNARQHFVVSSNNLTKLKIFVEWLAGNFGCIIICLSTLTIEKLMKLMGESWQPIIAIHDENDGLTMWVTLIRS
jgi:hypothetical protein